MTRYAAFLRGINLGKSRRIAMPALREAVESCEYADVHTYIASGNVVLTAADPPRRVESAITEAIKVAFGFNCDVFVRTAEELQTIVADNPWPDADPARVTVALLRHPPSKDVASNIAALAHPQETFRLTEREIYVNYRRGQAGSTLAASFADVIGQTCSVRNMRTMAKVAELC